MSKKKNNTAVLNYNPNWEVFFEYDHNGTTITQGMPLKFKYARGEYRFDKFVKNSKTKTEWFDCIGPDGYRSFYLCDFKGIIKPRQKRVKRNNG